MFPGDAGIMLRETKHRLTLQKMMRTSLFGQLSVTNSEPDNENILSL
jgi:hypothetical protein